TIGWGIADSCLGSFVDNCIEKNGENRKILISSRNNLYFCGINHNIHNFMLANSKMKKVSLSEYGIENDNIRYQLTPEELHNITLEKGQGVEASSGALAVNTGEFTGRSPKDRFIVKDEVTRDEVWWGDINIPFEPEKFDALYKRVTDYLSAQEEVYVR